MAGDESDDLVAAVVAFDAELKRFARACESAQKRPLDSQKNLERVAEALNEAREAERQLGPRAQAMMAALSAAREQQQVQAESARQRVEEFNQRTQVFHDLMERYRAIGMEAGELNGLAQKFAEAKREGAEAMDANELRTGLGDFDTRLLKVATDAQELATAGREADYEEVAREAHSLHQKLLAMRNKIKLVRESLGLVN
jgi:hypothetical protein